MGLSAEKLQTVRERADIVKVIGKHVALRKRGERYLGLCPFHPEKTPSFSVTPEKHMFYCFGCHAGGDVFSFVMRHQGLDFHGAVRWIARDVGVEVEPETKEQQAKREAEQKLLDVNQAALDYFCQALASPMGETARRYLQHRRVPPPMALSFRLGFGGRAASLLAHLKRAGIAPATAVQAGLLSDDGQRGLFDDRVIFPIFDAQHRIVGFGGRALADNRGPKYVNSKESLLFNKRRLLYGWDHAEASIRSSRRVVLVEGYTDVLACHRAGCKEAVATLGTAFTEEHAKVVMGLAKEAVLLLDADPAGLNGMREATEKLLQCHLKTLIVGLPRGEDPDSLLNRNGTAALQSHLKQARPALEFFIDGAFTGPDMSIEDRARAASTLAPLLAALSGLERDLYTARIAEKVGVSPEQLERHLRESLKRTRKVGSTQPSAKAGLGGEDDEGAKVANLSTDSTPTTAAGAAPKYDVIELNMLRELLLYPELRPRFAELAEFSLSDDMRLFWDDLAQTEKNVTEVITHYLKDQEWGRRLISVKPIDAEGLGPEADHGHIIERSLQTFHDILTRLKLRHLDTALKDVVHDIHAVEKTGGSIEELMQRKRELSRKKLELKNRACSP